jgi:hypothetical protein
MYVDVASSVCACADIMGAMLRHERYRVAFASDGIYFHLHGFLLSAEIALVACRSCIPILIPRQLGRSFNAEAFRGICQ